MAGFSMRDKVRIGAYKGTIETRQRGNHYVSIIMAMRDKAHGTINLRTVTYDNQEQAEEGHVEQLKILERKLENLVNN